jgi:hypothetical protein
MDNHAFLLQHTIFGLLPSQNPSNEEEKSFAPLIILTRLLDVPKMVVIGWNRNAEIPVKSIH